MRSADLGDCFDAWKRGEFHPDDPSFLAFCFARKREHRRLEIEEELYDVLAERWEDRIRNYGRKQPGFFEFLLHQEVIAANAGLPLPTESHCVALFAAAEKFKREVIDLGHDRERAIKILALRYSASGDWDELNYAQILAKANAAYCSMFPSAAPKTPGGERHLRLVYSRD